MKKFLFVILLLPMLSVSQEIDMDAFENSTKKEKKEKKDGPLNLEYNFIATTPSLIHLDTSSSVLYPYFKAKSSFEANMFIGLEKGNNIFGLELGANYSIYECNFNHYLGAYDTLGFVWTLGDKIYYSQQKFSNTNFPIKLLYKRLFGSKKVKSYLSVALGLQYSKGGQYDWQAVVDSIGDYSISYWYKHFAKENEFNPILPHRSICPIQIVGYGINIPISQLTSLNIELNVQLKTLLPLPEEKLYRGEYYGNGDMCIEPIPLTQFITLGTKIGFSF